MSIVLLLGIVCGLSILWLLVKGTIIIIRPFRPNVLKHLPGPKNESFIFGNLPSIVKDHSLKPQLEWVKEFKSPLIYYRFIWNQDRVLVVDPALVQHVLNKPTIFGKRNLPGYALLRLVLGDGLITLDGEAHTHHRKLINPAFKHAQLKELISVFTHQTQVLIDELNRYEDGEQVAINELMNKVTLNIIGLAGFGFDFTAFEREKDTIGLQTYRAFSGLISKHDVITAFVPFVKYLPLPSNIRAGLNWRFLNQVVLKLVKSKRAALNSKKETEAYRTHDILDLLIQARDEETGFALTDRELSSHVKTFLGAGHETTSMMLTWAFYLLSQHPRVVDKIRQEILEQLGTRSDFTYAELEKLTYLTMVLKEVLRLYPPASVVARRTNCDTQLGDCTIPKNTVCIISPYVLGHDPSAWDKPEEFIPERWENENAVHPGQFVPFLKGPRNCIGQKFAMVEGKVILLMVMQNFSFGLSKEDFSKVVPTLHVTLRPTKDLMMSVHRVSK